MRGWWTPGRGRDNDVGTNGDHAQNVGICSVLPLETTWMPGVDAVTSVQALCEHAQTTGIHSPFATLCNTLQRDVLPVWHKTHRHKR